MQHQPNMSLQTSEEKQMGMFLHLSQLINVILPPGGIIAPIVIWQMKKDQLPALDAHGKMVANWQISSLIYFFVAGLIVGIGIPLMIVIVGFLLVILGGLAIAAIGLMGIIFSIIGGIKANNGEFWEYPLTIKFIK
jgi:hypothetical protein